MILLKVHNKESLFVFPSNQPEKNKIDVDKQSTVIVYARVIRSDLASLFMKTEGIKWIKEAKGI